MKLKLIISILILQILIAANVFANTNFRIMTYNALFFPSQDGESRKEFFGTIFAEVEPDILLMQEIETSSGADMLLDELNSNGAEYSRSSLISGYGSLYSILFYKNSVAYLNSQNTIATPRRDIYEYALSIDGNSFNVYSCHLKASDECEQERLEEVLLLRDHLEALSPETEYLIVGDMNFYTNTEPAYQNLTITTPQIAQDLCEEVGSWHNSYALRSSHTQCTRESSFGGGAGGGLDDKFDFIFSSPNLNNGNGIEYVENSFISYGNDANHFNQSINTGTNSAVSTQVANALYNASDHLPVFADFVSYTELPGIELFISEYIEGSSYNKAIEIYNPSNEIRDLAFYNLEIYYNGSASGTTLNLSGNIHSDSTFVVSNTSACAEILSKTDMTISNLDFNGDDAVCLQKNNLKLDQIGRIGEDPGNGWSVAGIGNATQNHTLIRKPEITSGDTVWSNSAGTDTTNSGWQVLSENNFSNLGSHSCNNPQITLICPNGGEVWARNNSYTISWNSEHVSNVIIEIINDAEADTTVLISSTPSNEEWIWEIPEAFARSDSYKIRIADVEDGFPTDLSDNYFSVVGLTTIAEIQTTIQGGSGPSPLEGDTVNTCGIVTAVGEDGYFLQDSSGAWNGIFVFDQTNSPTIGDSLQIEGVVAEYYEKTEITDLINFSILSTGNSLPDIVAIPTGEVSQEKYEGVFIQINNAECINTDLGYGEWKVDDGSGDCRIDDAIYSFTPTLNALYNIIGVVDYTYDNFKIEPRMSSDLSLNPPQNVIITVNTGSVTISWDEVNSATSYRIYSDLTPNGNFETLEAEVSDTSWTDTASETKKFYHVIAIN